MQLFTLFLHHRDTRRKKQMKKIQYYIIVLMALATTMTSCFPREDILNPSTNLSFALGELRANAAGDGYIVLDDSTTVGIIPSTKINDSVCNKRYYVEGYIADKNKTLPGYDMTIDATILLPVAVDTIVEANSQEILNKVGNDRYEINNNGIFSSGRFINVFMHMPASGNIRHRIALIHNSVMPTIADRNDTIYFELCHNANNDIPQSDFRSILSFDIQKFLLEHPDRLVIGIWHYKNSIESPKVVTYFNIYNK